MGIVLFLELNLSKLYLLFLPEEFHVDAVYLFVSWFIPGPCCTTFVLSHRLNSSKLV